MRFVTKGRFSFRGGVHPPEKKELTRDSEIQPGPAVKQVAIMLSQHIGAVCEPLVNKADAVGKKSATAMPLSLLRFIRPSTAR